MPAQLKEVNALVKALAALEELRGAATIAVDEKRDWFDDKSEKWQESDKGAEWSTYLDAAENLLTELDYAGLADIDVSDLETT